MDPLRKVDQPLVISTAVIFIIAFIAAIIFFSTPKSHDFDFVDQPTLGNFSSPVQVVVFQDLMCDDCKYFMLHVFPAIEEKYIKTDLISFKMIPIAFLPYSKEIGAAALCLYNQNESLYWAFVKAWYASLPTYKVELSLSALLNSFPTINKESLDNCRRSSEILSKLKKNLYLAEQLLQSQISVPAILINGKKITVNSIEAISTVIDNIINEGSGNVEAH